MSDSPFKLHPDDLCRFLDQQQSIAKSLERIADRLDEITEDVDADGRRGGSLLRIGGFVA